MKEKKKHVFVILLFAEKIWRTWSDTQTQVLNIVHKYIAIFPILTILFLLHCSNNTSHRISLVKLGIDFSRRPVSNLLINNNYFAFFVRGVDRGVYFYDYAEKKEVSNLNLNNLGLKKYNMFCFNNKDEIWLAKREKQLIKSQELPELNVAIFFWT